MPRICRSTRHWVIAAFSCAAILAGAEVPAVAGGTDASATSIIRQLAPTAPSSQSTITSPSPGGTDKRATRLIRQPATVHAHSIRSRPVTIVIDRAYSLDFDVFFEFDSDALTPSAKASLRELGRALSSAELSRYDFLVAGHTDAKGDAGYNLDLSARRAIAVARYLVDAFPIDPSRLYTAGFGETQLRRPDQPTAGINRRVEVSLVAEVQ